MFTPMDHSTPPPICLLDMEPRRVADFPDSMHESAYGSMANSSAGDASISQPDLNQISISDASGPAVSPDASGTPSLQSPELMMTWMFENFQAEMHRLLESQAAQLHQLLESQAADCTARVAKAECKLAALEERHARRSRARAEKRASQNALVPLELPQP